MLDTIKLEPYGQWRKRLVEQGVRLPDRLGDVRLAKAEFEDFFPLGAFRLGPHPERLESALIRKLVMLLKRYSGFRQARLERIKREIKKKNYAVPARAVAEKWCRSMKKEAKPQNR
jgi:hypothetical protein